MNEKIVREVKKYYDEIYVKYRKANNLLQRVIKDTYEGKYLLCKPEYDYIGLVYVIENKENYGLRGKIVWNDGDIDDWFVDNICEILENYELCSYDKAIKVFPIYLEVREKMLESIK